MSQIQRCLTEISPLALQSVKQFHIEITLSYSIEAGSVPDIEIAALWPFSHLINSAASLETVHLRISKPRFDILDIEEIGVPSRWSRLSNTLSCSILARSKPFTLTVDCANFYIDHRPDVHKVERLAAHFSSTRIEALSMLVPEVIKSLGYVNASDQELFKTPNLSSIPRINMSGCEEMFQLRTAAHIGVTRLQLNVYSILIDSLSSAIITFDKVEDLRITFIGEFAVCKAIFCNITAPKLRKLRVEPLEPQDFEEGANLLSSFCMDHTALQDFTLALSHVHDMTEIGRKGLEQLKRIMLDSGSQLHLLVHQDAPNRSDRRPHMIALPDSLFPEIESLAIVIHPSSVGATQRASRLLLPSLTRLSFILNTYDSARSAVHWYLDGLELPALESLVIELGAGPHTSKILPLQPINAHLPLLPTFCAIQVKGNVAQASTAPRVDFWDTREGAVLKRQCRQLGISLSYHPINGASEFIR